jgi:polysaccharide export outer membrane protein
MKYIALQRLLVAGLLLPLVGCASGSLSVRPSPELAVVRGQALPMPEANDTTPGSTDYVIGPLDKLSISVVGLPELSRDEVLVDAAGNVGVPLAGTLRAGGLSPTQLAANIAEGLRARKVRDPQVSVTMAEIVSQVVAVEGEVKKPGIFPMEGRMTLLRALAKVEGPTEFARTNEILIFRTVGGQRLVGVYDLRALRSGTYADPQVFANDLIVVGDSPRRRVFKTLIEGAALLSPLVYILQ